MREFGSEFENISLPDNYFSKQCSLFKNHKYTRSGREAISLIAISIRKKAVETKSIVLLPSYICPSMIVAFDNKAWDIYYYNLNKDFTVNQSDLTSKIRFYKPACVFIANYFGKTENENIIDLIKTAQPKVNIVYDVTHSLLSLPELYNDKIDYYVASLRKWFGIADGGFVLTNNFLMMDIVKTNDNSKFINMRELSLNFKKVYMSNNDVKLKKKFKENLRNAELFLNTEFIYRMSERTLIKLNSLNISEIKRKRNINYLHLLDQIKSNPSIRLAVNIEEDKLKYYTFMLPLLFENRYEMQKIYSDNGLYTQVIWKIPTNAQQCKNSVFISNRILCVPIDQRYNYWDIEDIAKIINDNTKL